MIITHLEQLRDANCRKVRVTLCHSCLPPITPPPGGTHTHTHPPAFPLRVHTKKQGSQEVPARGPGTNHLQGLFRTQNKQVGAEAFCGVELRLAQVGGLNQLISPLQGGSIYADESGGRAAQQGTQGTTEQWWAGQEGARAPVAVPGTPRSWRWGARWGEPGAGCCEHRPPPHSAAPRRHQPSFGSSGRRLILEE